MDPGRMDLERRKRTDPAARFAGGGPGVFRARGIPENIDKFTRFSCKFLKITDHASGCNQKSYHANLSVPHSDMAAKKVFRRPPHLPATARISSRTASRRQSLIHQSALTPAFARIRAPARGKIGRANREEFRWTRAGWIWKEESERTRRPVSEPLPLAGFGHRVADAAHIVDEGRLCGVVAELAAEFLHEVAHRLHARVLAP